MKKLIIIVGCLLFGCQSFPYQFKLNSIETIFRKSNTIAIAPFSFWEDSINEKHIQPYSVFEDSIGCRLRTIGLKSIKSKELGNMFADLRNKYQGFYNMKTGKLDTLKLGKYRSEAIAYLCDSFKVCGVLFPRLILTNAKVINSSICWHGRIYGTTPFVSMNGKVPALSLLISIYNCNNEEVFKNAGGLTPFAEFNSIGNEIKIEEGKLLTNSNNTSKAMDILFEPINQELKEKKK
jgi:hypothetical protein